MDDGTTIARLRTDLLWASGLATLSEFRKRGTGALIGFDRVRPAPRTDFQPRRHLEVTPATLDRLIGALKRWRVDIVSIDEACNRIAEKTRHRFVSLSFNASYREFMTSARPILTQRELPYTVYVPSAFPDGIAEPWWLALEAVIARHERISVVIDRKEMYFIAVKTLAKQQLYDHLHAWLRKVSPVELSYAINDLCTRYDVDIRALARDISITWDDINSLAGDSRATIGSATVNYPVLSNMTDDAAQREIAMGCAVLETALRQPVRHFAFPFGDEQSFASRHVEIARKARFASAVTAIPGPLKPDTDMHCLPRYVWTRRMTLRGLRVRLAGY